MPRGRLPVYPDADCEIGLRLYNEGMPWPEVAEVTGVPWAVLRDRAHVRGWHVKHRIRRARAARLRMSTDPVDLSYLAAMIDGEGHICRRAPERGRQAAYTVGISNLSTDLMDWLAQMGGTITQHPTSGVYVWKTSARRDVQRLLRSVLPYLKIKTAKARAALAELDAAP